MQQAAAPPALFGYGLGVILGVLLFIKKVWHLDSVGQGMVGGSLAVGAVIGAAFAGRLADRLGRRRTIVPAAAVFAVGTRTHTRMPDPAARITSVPVTATGGLLFPSESKGS
ncbi:MAG TPA: MFS transporter [Pseudonocardiaceae bacterium]|nr:MFS transporter [Pseudonocardiaceae bacterium]